MSCKSANIENKRPFKDQVEYISVYRNDTIVDTAQVYLSKKDTLIGNIPYYKFYIKRNNGSYIIWPLHISSGKGGVYFFVENKSQQKMTGKLFDFEMPDSTQNTDYKNGKMYFINSKVAPNEEDIIYNYYILCDLNKCPSYGLSVSKTKGITKIKLIGNAVLYLLD